MAELTETHRIQEAVNRAFRHALHIDNNAVVDLPLDLQIHHLADAIADLRHAYYMKRDQVENAHHQLDMLDVPRDENITPSGRLMLLRERIDQLKEAARNGLALAALVRNGCGPLVPEYRARQSRICNVLGICHSEIKDLVGPLLLRLYGRTEDGIRRSPETGGHPWE